jgi:methylated-DNA-[protein]-cysteine S-methyltransferase
VRGHGQRHGLELGGPADVSDGSACRGHLGRAVDQLVSYSKGDLHAFDLPLDLRGTEFQVRVWAALLDIPRGATITYGELARRVDCPGGSQAVGSANGSNPVPIVVPCHRVVAANGLGGFTGGLARKEALLAIEGTLLL